VAFAGHAKGLMQVIAQLLTGDGPSEGLRVRGLMADKAERFMA
jgi:hypothetical protein